MWLSNLPFLLCTALGRHRAVISKKKLLHKAKMKETEYAIIEMREFLQHSLSYTGLSCSFYSFGFYDDAFEVT